jgi:hypothetical protein
MPFCKLKSPPPAYVSDTITATEDHLENEHSKDPYYSQDEDLLSNGEDARSGSIHEPSKDPNSSSEDLSSTENPKSNSTHNSSAEDLLADDYAQLSLTSTTITTPTPVTSEKTKAKTKKSRITWKNVKKHTMEKDTVKDAATAGYAGFVKGKQTLDLKNTQLATPQQMSVQVAWKVGKAVVLGAIEGKKTWDETQKRKKEVGLKGDVDGSAAG